MHSQTKGRSNISKERQFIIIFIIIYMISYYVPFSYKMFSTPSIKKLKRYSESHK